MTLTINESMHAAPSPIRIVLADDHKVVRDGLQSLLEREPKYSVVGTASDGRFLVEQILSLKPDAVLSDMSMPDLNGIEAAQMVREAGYAGAIVLLSQHGERSVVARAIAAGVNAYVHKDHAFKQVVAALDAALRGETWISPQLGINLENGSVPTLSEVLSLREREVLQLLAEGKNVKEAGAILGISHKTVEAHRANLFTKLKVTNIVELAHLAVKEGVAKA